ncbi:MAG: hypothetical protein GY769_11530, partial [bacterium]|nr:hypothetical protein [bacterium]
VEREAVPYEQVAAKRMRILMDDRLAIFQHPTTAIAFSGVSVGERAVLEFAIVISQYAWNKAGDGVRFSIESIDQEGRRRERYSRYIDPKQNPNQRKWLEERVDLSDLSGQVVTIFFRTSPGPEDNRFYDWAAWGNPRLVADHVE